MCLDPRTVWTDCAWAAGCGGVMWKPRPKRMQIVYDIVAVVIEASTDPELQILNSKTVKDLETSP